MEDLKNPPTTVVKSAPKKIIDDDDDIYAAGRGRGKKMSIVDMISHDHDQMRRRMMLGDHEDADYNDAAARNDGDNEYDSDAEEKLEIIELENNKNNVDKRDVSAKVNFPQSHFV
jgi:hypothetical protein